MKGTDVETNQTIQTDERRDRGPVMSPRTDIREAGDHFSLEIELPDVAPGDIDLQVEEDELRINATRNDRREAGKNQIYLIRECRNGTYSRVFRLGALIDRDAIEGRMTDGVLRVRLPKHKSALPRRIAIG